ncbi:MAG: choice-of-anchor I family protein [Treponema sp.]|nr:choice-of-anchor I family protein [Treponema sp.]MCL2251882.1 choice-of-anchor I family protein [Treponema sp.]
MKKITGIAQQCALLNKLILIVIIAILFISCQSTQSGNQTLKQSINGKLTYIGSYSTGSVSESGGVAEIVVYNNDNKKIYLVNGVLGSLDIVDASGLRSGRFIEMPLYKRIDINAMGEANSFNYGDLTSVAVSTKNKMIALAVHHKNFNEQGYIVLLNYEGEYIRHYQAGVQPDMICFTPDGQFILTADEGEPRDGYGADKIDPPGTITIVNVKTHAARIIGFEAFDNAQARADFLQSGGILNKGIPPSLDFEPEYISISEDSSTAYIALQEANAIAVLDIANGKFTSVIGLGFKNHNLPQNSLDVLRNGKAELNTQNLYGVYQPDGIAVVTIKGSTYLLTANEGDAREWGSGSSAYNDILQFNIDGNRIDTINNSLKEGLVDGERYLFGARSFSIWDVSGKTAALVYDSGNEFETRTAEYFPNNFNASHTNNELDSRSGRKGPEPEYITTLQAGKNIFAVIGLERIGGIMLYDISNPAAPEFTDYINTRDFSGSELKNMGDLGPEGLYAVEASASPTKRPIIFVANEISGTISVYEFK